jgi:hypothetical protein
MSQRTPSTTIIEKEKYIKIKFDIHKKGEKRGIH